MTDRTAQLTQLLEADPNDPFVTYALAMEHRKTGAHDDAVRWFDRTLEIDPDYHYAYFHKARVLEEANQPEAALACARQGLERARAGGDAKTIAELEDLIRLLD